MKTPVNYSRIALALLTFLAFRSECPAFTLVGTAFTYQGRLNYGAGPATGTYDLLFTLYDSTNDPGTVVAGPLTNSATGVANGLFIVTLDFGTNAFNLTERWLEIGVRTNGTTAFATLAPRQRITPTPYAIRALTAGGVVDGSITSASISPGGLNGSVIQPGTVTSNLLAPGAVTVSALQSPYQSGSIALDAFTPAAYFGSTVIHQAVNFSQGFASTPGVTVGLETGSRAVSTTVPPILVSGKTTTGFTATFTVKSTPVVLANNASTYFYSGFPLLVVNGRPAAAFNSPNLNYARAQDALGQRWPAASSIAPAAQHIDLAIVNGNPAIAFAGGNSLQFVRANDVDGASWPAPLTIKAAAPGSFAAQVVSLAIISGRPAAACWNSVSNELYYFRANDSNGNSWPGTGVLVATGSHFDFQLADVSGNPAIAYSWDNGLAYNNSSYQTEIRFIRALDATGGSWPASPVTITNFGVLHLLSGTRMLMLGTNPAVAFGHTAGYNDYEVAFVKASNSSGSAWGSQKIISFNSSYSPTSLTFALVNGNPAVAWFDFDWSYAESSNGGASFSRYFLGNPGVYPGTLAEVQGKPALTMNNNGDVGYLRDTTPISDSYINWIAVQP